jgi:hypothetical protein
MTEAGPDLETTTGPAADPLGLVAGSLAFGASLGVGCQGLVTTAVRTLQVGSTAKPSLTSLPTLVLLGGTLLGIVAAGFATWTMLTPIRNPWRQAMLAIIAGLGSFVVAAIILAVVDGAFGRPGLLAVAALAGLACLLIGRRLTGHPAGR